MNSLPEYYCAKIAQEIEVTGYGDNPLWSNADVMTLHNMTKDNEKPVKTEVRMMYSDTCLYISAKCEDNYITASFTDRDDPVFTEECMEFFLSPTSLMRHYYEINFSPTNVLFDSFIINHRSPEKPKEKFVGLTQFDCEGLVSKTIINGQMDAHGDFNWSLEVAIPFFNLQGPDNVIPNSGDSWRMNVYRIDIADASKKQYHYAWSPFEEIDFHRPWGFGKLIFK
jgi:hypothetical protein